MRDDHPAEQCRAIMAELDAPPPPDPPPPAPEPPRPRPVVVAPPPRTSLWDVIRALVPILIVLGGLVFAFVIYHLTH